MTHKIPKTAVCSLPIPKHINVPKPFFSLFSKTATGKYVRISSHAYYCERVAFHMFCSRIKEAPLSLTIRKVFIDPPMAGKHKGVTYNSHRDSPLRERVSK